MSNNFESWWSDYMLFTAREPGSRLSRRQANFLWAASQGNVRRIAPNKNRTLCSGEPPHVEFYDRSLVSSCVAKGLFDFPGCKLTHEATELFSAVARHADTRPLDLPDDAPRPYVNRKPGRPQSRFAKTWRTLSPELQAELSRALMPFRVPLVYQSHPGFISEVRSYRDPLSGNEYSEATHRVRYCFNNLKWRALSTEDQRLAGLASDVLRAAFNPMQSLQRSHLIIQPGKLNTSADTVRSALASPEVQEVLKKLQPLFLPGGTPEQCLSFTYDPNVSVPSTKLGRILELEAVNAKLLADNVELTAENARLQAQLDSFTNVN